MTRQYNDFTSSTINKLWYNDQKQELIVEFKSGQQYRYNDVSLQQWDNLIKSQSKGRYLHQSIKSKPFQKMQLND